MSPTENATFKKDAIYYLVFSKPVDILVDIDAYITTQDISVYLFHTSDESHTLCYRIPGADYGFVVGDWFNHVVFIKEDQCIH